MLRTNQCRMFTNVTLERDWIESAKGNKNTTGWGNYNRCDHWLTGWNAVPKYISVVIKLHNRDAGMETYIRREMRKRSSRKSGCTCDHDGYRWSFSSFRPYVAIWLVTLERDWIESAKGFKNATYKGEHYNRFDHSLAEMLYPNIIVMWCCTTDAEMESQKTRNKCKKE